MAPSNQTPNGTGNRTGTPPLDTHGTQNNFRADGRDEGTTVFNSNGNFNGSTNRSAAPNTQRRPPRPAWDGPTAVSGGLTDNDDPFVDGVPATSTNLNAAAMDFMPALATGVSDMNIGNQAGPSEPTIANGTGYAPRVNLPPVQTSYQQVAHGSSEPTSPNTVNISRFIEVKHVTRDMLRSGPLATIMQLGGWESHVKNLGLLKKIGSDEEGYNLYIYSNSLAYAQALSNMLKDASPPDSFQVSSISWTKFTTVAAGSEPQTKYPGQLHIDVQYTGRVDDFDAEKLKKKVRDFLIGLVNKHHEATKRKLFSNSNITAKPMQAFDIRGIPQYPALHFRAECDEVADAEYLIGELSRDSASSEATFSDMKVIVKQFDPEHFKNLVRDSDGFNSAPDANYGMFNNGPFIPNNTNGMLNNMPLGFNGGNNMFAGGEFTGGPIANPAYTNGPYANPAYGGALMNGNGTFHTPHGSMSSVGTQSFVSSTGRTTAHVMPDGREVVMPGSVRPERLQRPSLNAPPHGVIGDSFAENQRWQDIPAGPMSGTPNRSQLWQDRRNQDQHNRDQRVHANQAGATVNNNSSPLSSRRWMPQEVLTEKIIHGGDIRTTLMVRNIPTQWGAEDIVRVLNGVVPGQFDFTYVRIDFQRGQAVGYAFVNFCSCASLTHFTTLWVDQKFPVDTRYPNARLNNKTCQVSYANTQGLECLIKKFRNSSIMDEAPGCRPKLWQETTDGSIGVERMFPGVDNQAKHQRSAENAVYIGLYKNNQRSNGRDSRHAHSTFDRGTTAQMRDEQQFAFNQANFNGYHPQNQAYPYGPGAMGNQPFNQPQDQAYPYGQGTIGWNQPSNQPQDQSYTFGANPNGSQLFNQAQNQGYAYLPGPAGNQPFNQPPMPMMPYGQYNTPYVGMAPSPQMNMGPPMETGQGMPMPGGSGPPYSHINARPAFNNHHMQMHMQQGHGPMRQSVPFGTGPGTPASRMRTRTNGQLGARTNVVGVAYPTPVNGSGAHAGSNQHNAEQFKSEEAPARENPTTPRYFGDDAGSNA